MKYSAFNIARIFLYNIMRDINFMEFFIFPFRLFLNLMFLLKLVK